MAASSMLSRSFVQTVAGVPSLGASQVKANIHSPFLAGLKVQGAQFHSQQGRRSLVVSAKQETNTPLVSHDPPILLCQMHFVAGSFVSVLIECTLKFSLFVFWLCST